MDTVLFIGGFETFHTCSRTCYVVDIQRTSVNFRLSLRLYRYLDLCIPHVMYWLQSQSRLPVDLCSKRVGFNSDDPRYISSLANLSSSLQKLSMQPEGSHVDGAERADALAIAKASVAIEERWQDLTLIPFVSTHIQNHQRK